MKNYWMLAAADEAPAVVPGTPIGEENDISGSKVGEDGEPNLPGNNGKSSPFGKQQLLFFGLMIVIMYMFLFRGPRKKQQKHRQMVKTLEKNDKVRTIGGILGTVVDVKDDEITIKIDESNNTKIKVIASAIGRNLTKEKIKWSK